MSERRSSSSTSSSTSLRRAAKLIDAVGVPIQFALRPTRTLGFPYRPPSRPKGVVVPRDPSKLGANYDTGWARRPPAKAVRAVIGKGPLRLAIRAIAQAQRSLADDGPHRLGRWAPRPTITAISTHPSW
jgi:hypothetical protein